MTSCIKAVLGPGFRPYNSACSAIITPATCFASGFAWAMDQKDAIEIIGLQCLEGYGNNLPYNS
jgi:hypothetical protein